MVKQVSEKKNFLSNIAVVVGLVISIGTVVYNFSGLQTKNNITYTKYEELDKSIKDLNESEVWTKTTLINHLKEADERNARTIRENQELRQMIIQQNNELIKALGEKNTKK
jgi:hypothetical protein